MVLALNKKLAIGIIIAVAVAIGIVYAISYGNNSSDTVNSDESTTEEPSGTTGKQLTLELNESVGITQNP